MMKTPLYATRFLCMLLLMIAASCVSTANHGVQLLSGGAPEYPANALAEGIEGVVRVRYDVLRDGTVANAVVVESNPVSIFDSAAIACVRSWSFRARHLNGEAVDTPGLVSTVEFRIGGADAYDHY